MFKKSLHIAVGKTLIQSRMHNRSRLCDPKKIRA